MKKEKEEKDLNEQEKKSCCENESHCDCEECVCEKTETENLEKKVEEYLLVAQRLQADFDNYRKRSQEQILQARTDGMINALNTIIPSLDSFASAKKQVSDEKVLAGLILIEKDILSALDILGVKKIECIGQRFDPNLHNALATKNDNSLDNDIIVEEYQAGYKLNEKIIRYSQVIVNKKEV
ncbi:MAG: nucleotide exchange factor GrpE [Clostridia bacterium]|nr:nucleotide exchange factor GrpE [Clostridia bacterium]